jgi:hypothetical protein
MITTETFAHLAFPVIKVKYLGPDDYNGARWSASIDRGGDIGVMRHTESYDDSLSAGATNAIVAAQKLWIKYCTKFNLDDTHVFIPGNLDDKHYCFTMVPSYCLNGE